MGDRLELHEELCDILGSRYAYFQPPSNIRMTYPCIRYSLGGLDIKRANDHLYNYTNRYEGIVIDYDPDSKIAIDIVKHFPMCSFGSPYVADNLYHYPFTLYY